MVANWAELDDEGWRIYAGLHRLLLRLAGRVPDELVTRARTMFGSGDWAYLPDVVVGSAVELGVSLTAAEVEVLRHMLVALDVPGGEPAGVDRVSISEVTPATIHQFYPAPPQVLVSAGARIPDRLDLTGGESDDLWDLPEELDPLADLAYDLTDLADQHVVDGLAEHAGVVGVWRAWRFGPDGPPEGGRRVYLVAVDPGVPAWALEADARRELADDEEFPQVEVYWTGDDLPPYHREALAHAARLWKRR